MYLTILWIDKPLHYIIVSKNWSFCQAFGYYKHYFKTNASEEKVNVYDVKCFKKLTTLVNFLVILLPTIFLEGKRNWLSNRGNCLSGQKHMFSQIWKRSQAIYRKDVIELILFLLWYCFLFIFWVPKTCYSTLEM